MTVVTWLAADNKKHVMMILFEHLCHLCDLSALLAFVPRHFHSSSTESTPFDARFLEVALATVASIVSSATREPCQLGDRRGVRARPCSIQHR